MFARHSLPALALAALLACGGDEPAPADAAAAVLAAPDPSSDPARTARTAAARARVDALVAEPGPATLLATLAQGHAVARELRGPHRLHYTAKFDMVPEAPAAVVVGEPIQQERHVVDELTLVWAAKPGEPPRLHLKQSTGGGEDQEVVIDGEQSFTRLAHRGWQSRALESELHNLRLDEAQHSVHDLVELAAPALAVAVATSDDTVTVTLSKAETTDPARVAAGYGREWRQRTEITAVAGTLTLERASGLWRTAELTVGYVVRDVKDRPQRGETQLTADVRAATAEDTVTPPDTSTPVPERVRYEVERQELLGGLAGA